MDNYFKNCPPLMSDGRHFTDWKGATRRNEYIKYINDILRDDDYRMLLQCNANKFMDKEWSYYTNKMNCWQNQCIHNYPTRTLPQFFAQELKAYNDSMDPTKPKLKNTCPHFKDYRLNTNQAGLTCHDNIDRKTGTKSFRPDELISNMNKAHPNSHTKQASVTIPAGTETAINYAPAGSTLVAPSASSMIGNLNAPKPKVQLYDPEVNDSDSSIDDSMSTDDILSSDDE